MAAAESATSYVRLDDAPARGARAARCSPRRLLCVACIACTFLALVFVCSTLRPPELALRSVAVRSVRLGPLRPASAGAGLHELDVLDLCRRVLGHVSLRLDATLHIANPNLVLAPFAAVALDALSITSAGVVVVSDPVSVPSVPPGGHISVPIRIDLPDLLAAPDDAAIRPVAAALAANTPLRMQFHVAAQVRVAPMAPVVARSACTLRVRLCPPALCHADARSGAASPAAAAAAAAATGAHDANAACMVELGTCFAEIARGEHAPASSEAHCSLANTSMAQIAQS